MMTCSQVLHIMCTVNFLILQIFWLLKLMYILTPKFPQIQSQSIYFLGGMPPDLPSISILLMLIVLCTITHMYNHLLYKRPYFYYVSLIREIYILGSPSLSNLHLLWGGSYHFAPPIFHCTLFRPPLAKILKETLSYAICWHELAINYIYNHTYVWFNCDLANSLTGQEKTLELKHVDITISNCKYYTLYNHYSVQ